MELFEILLRTPLLTCNWQPLRPSGDYSKHPIREVAIVRKKNTVTTVTVTKPVIKKATLLTFENI